MINHVTKVQSYWHKSNQTFINLCTKSKQLYNRANYLCRQNYFKHKDSENILQVFLFYYDLYELLKKQDCYKNLPAAAAQSILRLVDKNWKSYRKSIKSYWKNKEKFKSLPKIPNYIKKDLFIFIIPGQGLTARNSILKLPISKFKIKLTDKFNDNKINQLRIIPKYNKFKIEIVYEQSIEILETLDKSKAISIDIGLSNLITITPNQSSLPTCMIKGGALKSINQYYNKKLAKLKSNLVNNNQKSSKRIQKLHYKREQKIQDYLHKASRKVINLCECLNIGTIIIGKNINWKQNINLGKRNNQNFVSIPFARLIEMISYKAKQLGINVILTQQMYTSKTDHLANQKMCKHKQYLGKRIKRGLFQSSTGKLINADVNGAIGIMRKVVGDDFNPANIGNVYNPIKIYV